MLIMSLDPPEAVLCEYVKAITADVHTDSGIGPTNTLAPEIITNGSEKYTNKIDIWAFAHACCYMLFRKWVGFRRKADRLWLDEIGALLARHRQLGRLEHQLVDLIQYMLPWSPAARPTAAEALQYPCMLATVPSSTPPHSQDNEQPPNKILRTEVPPLPVLRVGSAPSRAAPFSEIPPERRLPCATISSEQRAGSEDDTEILAGPPSTVAMADQSINAGLIYTTSIENAESQSTLRQYGAERAKSPPLGTRKTYSN